MKLHLAITLASFLLTTTLAQASDVNFTHAGSGSGSLAGVPFPTSDFTIVGVGDPLNRQSFSGGFFIDHSSASVTITGVGTVTFISPTRTFVNNSATVVGFSRAGSSGLDLFNGPSDPSLGAWDMQVAIGPIAGTGNLIQWSSGTVVDTSGGILIFDSGSAPCTFTAGSVGPPGSAYCFGDASGASCPCSAFGSPGEGCANTGGAGGATLAATGSTSLSHDTLQFDIAGVPGSKPGLILRGDNQVAIAAGDGILCTAGGSQRSQVQITSAGATTFTNFNGAGFGQVANVGAPTNFQFWYRDPSNACSGAGFNFSNAWTVTYQP